MALSAPCSGSAFALRLGFACAFGVGWPPCATRAPSIRPPFAARAWSTEAANSFRGEAPPTPTTSLLAGSLASELHAAMAARRLHPAAAHPIHLLHERAPPEIPTNLKLSINPTYCAD